MNHRNKIKSFIITTFTALSFQLNAAVLTNLNILQYKGINEDTGQTEAIYINKEKTPVSVSFLENSLKLEFTTIDNKKEVIQIHLESDKFNPYVDNQKYKMMLSFIELNGLQLLRQSLLQPNAMIILKQQKLIGFQSSDYTLDQVYLKGLKSVSDVLLETANDIISKQIQQAQAIQEKTENKKYKEFGFNSGLGAVYSCRSFFMR